MTMAETGAYRPTARKTIHDDGDEEAEPNRFDGLSLPLLRGQSNSSPDHRLSFP
jgi:hypothetical protein